MDAAGAPLGPDDPVCGGEVHVPAIVLHISRYRTYLPRHRTYRTYLPGSLPIVPSVIIPLISVVAQKLFFFRIRIRLFRKFQIGDRIKGMWWLIRGCGGS